MAAPVAVGAEAPATPAPPSRAPLADYVAGSPSQARVALEAHISDTDRRIRDASLLGTTLLDQKQQLLDRLVEVEEYADQAQLAPGLRQKLVDLEREFNEVGQETSRLFSPHHRGKKPSRDFGQHDPFELSANGRTSPTKLNIPSASTSTPARKARHGHSASSSQVKDLELATEISTSLLSEVRSLQAQLAEKDEALRHSQKDTSELHTHTEALAQRLRSVDDNEQRYKDENWNLETQVQDLSNAIKDVSTREERLRLALSVAKNEKSTADREYEELRQGHGRLVEDHSTLRRQHDLELSGLRRTMADGEAERERMQRSIDELTSQNQDLAKAVAYRVKNEPGARDVSEMTNDEDAAENLSTPEGSPPPSPSKFATPRHHGALESETLKSSLTHAHRMIQNLKNNIHREKTEKVELRRMLQSTQDELESRRNEGVTAANAGRKRRPASAQDAFKKPANPSRLGGGKGTSEEILNDPSWEEYSEEAPIRKSIEKDEHSTDASDAFETADERNTTDDTDAFETAESANGDSTDGDATETESHASAQGRKIGHRHRDSYQSTASDELDDTFDMSTPPASFPRYRLGLTRGGLSRSVTPGSRASPAPSFMSNNSGPVSGMNLAAELEGMDDASNASGTPVRSTVSPRFSRTPETDISRRDTIRASTQPPAPVMVESGMMTEPWKPEDSESEPSTPTNVAKTGVTAAVGAAAGAAFTSVFGGVGSPSATASTVTSTAASTQTEIEEKPQPVFERSSITSQSTTPIAPKPVIMPTPKKSEAVRTPLAAKSPNIPPRVASTKVLADPKEGQEPEFIPPPVPSIRKNHNLTPATQAFLNDVLGRAHNRSKSQPQSTPATPERNIKANVTSTSTPRRKTVNSEGSPARPEGRPSFTISIEGRGNSSSVAASPGIGRSRKSSATSAYNSRGAGHSDLDALEPALHVEKKDDGTFVEPTLQFPSSDDEMPERPRTAIGTPSSNAATPSRVATSVSRATAGGKTESGTQTAMTGDQIESLSSSARKPALTGLNTFQTGSPRQAKTTGRAMSLGSTTDQSFLKSLKKPTGSPGSRRPTSPPPSVPPLPADHREVIAAAASRTSSLLSIQPPNMSSVKVQQPQSPIAPRTPSSHIASQMRPSGSSRNRNSSVARSEMSRRSSVSSFASELDARFNIAPPNRSSQNLLGDGYDGGNATDPRMIQAITQTMIGEYLFKYVRKTGRGEHSDNRHRRFFWIHPYTKTLYWSTHDPSAGRNELKAKSVQIEAVRVVTDENPNPPGLHQKSIVVVTPGRSIKFTAPTSYRHETWFNALSYLLLRAVPDPNNSSGAGKVVNSARNYSNYSAVGHGNERSSTMGSAVTNDDLAEFNPSTGGPRAASRTSQRSSTANNRSSMYTMPTLGTPSSGSNGGQRTSAPQGVNNSLAYRQSSSSLANKRASHLSEGGLSSGSPMRGPHAPIEPIVEVATRQNSVRNSVNNTAPSGSGSADASGEAVTVDADGFKKPARPLSLAKSASRPGMRETSSSDAGTRQSVDSPHGGRLSNLASKLRRKSRAKSLVGGDDDADNSAAAGPSTSTANATKSSGDRLENVRACCDGMSSPRFVLPERRNMCQ